MKVLLVEDDALIQQLLSEVVSTMLEGCELLTADTLAETRVILGENTDISIILWDGELKDGFTTDGLLVESIKKHPNILHVGISAAVIDLQKEQGCQVCLRKPFPILKLGSNAS